MVSDCCFFTIISLCSRTVLFVLRCMYRGVWDACEPRCVIRSKPTFSFIPCGALIPPYTSALSNYYVDAMFVEAKTRFDEVQGRYAALQTEVCMMHHDRCVAFACDPCTYVSRGGGVKKELSRVCVFFWHISVRRPSFLLLSLSHVLGFSSIRWGVARIHNARVNKTLCPPHGGSQQIHCIVVKRKTVMYAVTTNAGNNLRPTLYMLRAAPSLEAAVV